ncbi:MAG: hypothetical protein DHS20C17_35970 [Cyclobacteriaceae bacterium]|nr:MAG: hypothetical protein DHS20C17_35970 [Cyclobacteriaceae bacterium]
MKRRRFLHRASHLLAAPGLIGGFGFSLPEQKALNSLLKFASESDRVLVIIYLEGGNDGLNTVVPLDQLSPLSRVRQQVFIPEERLLPLNNTQVGLHPSLAGFRSLFNEGRLGIIQSVGYPDQNFSHFRSTDIWMSASDSKQLVTSGWSGRYLSNQFPGYPESYPNEEFTDPLAVEIGYGASLVFQGPEAAMGMVVSNPDSFYDLLENIEEPAPDTLAGEKLRYVRLIAKQSELYGEVVKQAASKITQQKSYPDGNALADQLKIVARLIAGGLKTPLYMVRLGGFDTHSNQVDQDNHTQGTHANLLRKLDGAVSSFMNDLEFLGVDDRVVGMTFSEFGRRIVSNASSGTDHGAAAPMFVFGNEVIGGVLGTNPEISRRATYEDNLDMQYDFRQIYASMLQQWLGSSESNNAEVFSREFDTVPIIGESYLSNLEASDLLKVYPNPVTGPAEIEFITNGSPLEVDLIDLQGRKLQGLYSGNPVAGFHRITWNPGKLNKGQYLVVLKGLDKPAVQKVIVLQ